MLQQNVLAQIGLTQSSVATSRGRIVYYSTSASRYRGEGENSTPPLVFLHGFGGGSSAYEWSKVFPAFAKEHSIYAPDLLGWGRSEHLTRSYHIDDYLTTIAEFIQQTCSAPVIAIASSLTAAFTIRVAIEHPELFRGLILTTPSGLSDFGNDYRSSFFAQLINLPLVDRLLYQFGVATPSGIRSFLEQRQFAQPNRVYEELVSAYLESAQQPNAEYSALSFVKGDLCFDLSLYIANLTTPTAMIWGQKSQFTGPEIGQRLAALNPQAIRHLVLLEDVGLTPQLELPAVTIGLIRQFIDEFSANSRQD